MNHGWQSESTDGLKVVGVVFFGVVTMVAVLTWSVTSPTTAGCNWCSAAPVVVVV